MEILEELPRRCSFSVILNINQTIYSPALISNAFMLLLKIYVEI